MKILILGAGRVGESVAESLISEKNDITVVDTDGVRLRDLESRFDLRGVVGNGISPEVRSEAGAADTDMLIACTSQDETNLVACKVAQVLFNIPTRIVRVRSVALKSQQALLEDSGFAVTHAFCPEEALMGYIGKLVRYPEALQVREFAQGHAALASVRARAGAPHRTGKATGANASNASTSATTAAVSVPSAADAWANASSLAEVNCSSLDRTGSVSWVACRSHGS